MIRRVSFPTPTRSANRSHSLSIHERRHNATLWRFSRFGRISPRILAPPEIIRAKVLPHGADTTSTRLRHGGRGQRDTDVTCYKSWNYSQGGKSRHLPLGVGPGSYLRNAPRQPRGAFPIYRETPGHRVLSRGESTPSTLSTPPARVRPPDLVSWVSSCAGACS